MYNFFYNFYKKRLAFDLFSRDPEDGTPSPPTELDRITDDGQTRITDDGQIRIID